MASCSTWDLRSSLRHTASLVVACKCLLVACGIQFPGQGSNLGCLHQELGVSHWTTREVPMQEFSLSSMFIGGKSGKCRFQLVIQRFLPTPAVYYRRKPEALGLNPGTVMLVSGSLLCFCFPTSWLHILRLVPLSW